MHSNMNIDALLMELNILPESVPGEVFLKKEKKIMLGKELI